MTLDPVHFDGIADLAAHITHEVDAEEHRDLADETWREFLDPLYGDDGPVLEPVDDLAKRAAPIEELALQPDAFDTAHGLDSGTINPRTFTNGLVLDLAQAAMSATPSELDCHRARTTITSVHSNDASVDTSTDWQTHDEGYWRGRIVHTTPLARDQERVVHGLALYLAESHHAREHAHRVEDLLLLDGPVYPKQLVNWADRHASLADLVTQNELVGEVLENYVRLVEDFADRGVPLAGFVKSPASQALVRALRDRGRPTPWATDAAFFGQVLERREFDGDDHHRRTDELTWTCWFTSTLGADGVFADADALGVDRELDAACYEVAFFVVYDPRTDLVHRVEVPRVFADDPDCRAAVERYVTSQVAAEAGPPKPVGKADELARISSDEKQELVRKLERVVGSREDRNYDDHRW
ncbi:MULTISPECIES: DNA double-strand break repair nuclease NurA [Halobacterium]|uniref:DNA double-strand break repair nuclease NurA n=1 Tax=Halobacterium TaxID=2239 RepID=UPI00196495C7|nr:MULTISPECIES: DNA double-strand break repair nuclease NurA [Halobacterium]MCF2207316.1 DNA double-strand break repair nuclease NurA [Halobacterium salinarum]MDL0123377.1 DNA double-strand break repair nuclease NurA [Halobacterium salinarum]QRY24226.1 DNA double-strand break repair nuclease NurA [Halobacterium sp. BOL4-2]